MLTTIYWIALAVVLLAALAIAVHDEIPGGFVGSTLLGCVAVFGMSGFDQSPPNWLVGFMASLALVCVWGGLRWQRCRIERCLTKVGGTD